jgi:hypothetical protein
LGILRNEDAQCFQVRSGIDVGVYVLAVGAVLLAFLNTFVKKAADQYLRDKKKSMMANDVHAVKVEEEPIIIAISMDIDTVKQRIEPVPVLFSDRFRWFLARSEDVDEEEEEKDCDDDDDDDDDNNNNCDGDDDSSDDKHPVVVSA